MAAPVWRSAIVAPVHSGESSAYDHVTGPAMHSPAKQMRRFHFAFYLTALVLSACLTTQAERLPLKAYTVADGLPNNVINKIVRDSRGFLWFCTGEGLSRFDGYSFRNYGVDQGLPHTMVNDFLETRSGELWVATNGGLTLFNPSGDQAGHIVYANERQQRPAMFTVVIPEEEDRAARAANVLLEDRKGTIWCGTMKHLYRLERGGNGFRLVPVDLGTKEVFILDLLEDRSGSLWIGTFTGLYCRGADGRIQHFTRGDGLPDENIHDLLQDHQGRLWAATRNGGFFRFKAADNELFVGEVHNRHNGFPTDWVFQLFETSDYKIWVATNAGIIQFSPEADKGEKPFLSYTQRNGLSFREITALNEDASGNLWLGTNVTGAMKLERHGFLTWDEQDGITVANSIFTDRAGEICLRAFVHSASSAGASSEQRLGVYDQGFHWFIPDALARTGWIFEQVTLQARNGEWWIGTGSGLFRFPATENLAQIKSARPLHVYGVSDGLATMQILRLFEDSSGDVWVSTIGAPNGLARWRHETDSIEDFGKTQGLPPLSSDAALAFGQDASGNVWIGLSSGLARYRQGNFTLFTTKDGLPPGGFQSLYLDHAGRLWSGSLRGGLVRVDNPAADQPAFIVYTTAQGLSSNGTGVIIEDSAGRIYGGTGRGLDQIDPETGHVKHFTTFDGLAPGAISSAFRDRHGALWFATQKGLSRFVPESNQASNAPPIVVNGLRVMGVAQHVSELGEKEVSLADLSVGQNQIQIDFVGLSFAIGDVLRYQYKLEGSTDWSAPTEQRTVNFASLSPGRYRFLVRAVNSDGIGSIQPAVVAFRILPPIWQRWWFVLLAFSAVTLVAYAFYRHRVARLLELERVRTRIASDLHDDIGSNLSLIAGLSEMLNAQMRNSNGQIAERLSTIAAVSRRSVDAMSDIVWAVNPKRDNVLDLSHRMRRFGNDILSARNIEFHLDAPNLDRNLRVNADVRREVFLIFKEGINNIARHSACTGAHAALRIDRGTIILTLKDDGHGFKTTNGSIGHGLESMRRRAEKLGGRLEVISKPREGTTITLSAPLGRQR
jgi:ligand-binding sensor domain-containing protein/signal transduction histidine kinase